MNLSACFWLNPALPEGCFGSKAVSRDQQLIQLLTCTRAIASHAVLTLFAPSMMGAAQPAYPASLSKA